jgi:hypothetical protein
VDLPHPTATSLSIVTPPKVTRVVLEQAKQAGVRAVWLQPGTFDEEVWGIALREFEICVGGEEVGTRGGEGWCVLVDGARAMAQVEREGGRMGSSL